MSLYGDIEYSENYIQAAKNGGPLDQMKGIESNRQTRFIPMKIPDNPE
jgi:hypothetical protein